MKNSITLKAIGLTMLVAAFVGFQSCDNNKANDQMMDNQEFVHDAASSNSFEIAAGNLAAANSQSDEIKAYGQMMVDDHGAVGAELTELATSKGWTIPTQMQQKHRADLERLTGLTGPEFDEEFINLMIKSHEEAVALFTDASDVETGVEDNTLRGFAAEKLPGLKAHLEEAKQLETTVDASNTMDTDSIKASDNRNDVINN